MKLTPLNNSIVIAHSILLIGCFILCLLLLAASFGLNYLSHHTKWKCSDFSSREDAQRALHNGATYLDKNHDGKPCEVIPT